MPSVFSQMLIASTSPQDLDEKIAIHSGSLFVQVVVELVRETLCKVSQIMEPCYGGELQDKAAAMSDSKNNRLEIHTFWKSNKQ